MNKLSAILISGCAALSIGVAPALAEHLAVVDVNSQSILLVDLDTKSGGGRDIGSINGYLYTTKPIHLKAGNIAYSNLSFVAMCGANMIVNKTEGFSANHVHLVSTPPHTDKVEPVTNGQPTNYRTIYNLICGGKDYSDHLKVGLDKAVAVFYKMNGH